MEKTVTLSGGNFGGRDISWPEGHNIVSVLDGAGVHWSYDITLHPTDTARADFCGCSPDARGSGVVLQTEQ